MSSCLSSGMMARMVLRMRAVSFLDCSVSINRTLPCLIRFSQLMKVLESKKMALRMSQKNVFPFFHLALTATRLPLGRVGTSPMRMRYSGSG